MSCQSVALKAIFEHFGWSNFHERKNERCVLRYFECPKMFYDVSLNKGHLSQATLVCPFEQEEL